MIRHFVRLRASPAASGETVDTLMRELAAVVDAVPGCSGFRVHRNISVEPHVMHGFTHGFELTFADEAARSAYLADPAHRAVGERIVAAIEGGSAGVIVFDHEVD